MAELKVKVVVDKKQLNELDTQIKKIKQTAKEIKIDITSATQAINAAKKLADANKAVENATKNRITAEKNLATQIQKTAQATAKMATEEQKTQREREKTTQSANRRAAAEVTAGAKIIASQQKTQQEIYKSERAVKQLSNAWKNMFSQFSLANIVSSGITRAISSMRSYFNEALQEMKALDLAATHYQQVMGSETTASATGALTQKAYSVGSKYGTSASDYMESVATYARAGYKQAAESLAELSMKTVIVGQTTQEVADQFLLAMDAAYGYQGSVSELSKVLDGASAIDSSYATTIEKIATGLGLVAPLAEQVHVSEAELTAAIGTITAATQRSGSEAARALRSLFLNIIKDTSTEIEDGVTATEESIASIQFLLEKYAASAVQAAEATGQVINPMEAIAALSQSMKEGLLSEQELMNLLSGIGGKLRISQLVALISNWDMYTDMIGTYETAMGSADEKTEKYLDSWEAKTNILKNTWTEFVAKTINTDTIKSILDGGAKLLKLIGDLGNGLKLIAGIIATISLAKKAAELTSLANAASASAREFAKSAETLGQARIALQKAESARFAASILSWSAIAIGAITAVSQAIKQAHNQRMQLLSESTAKVVQSAKEEQAEAETAYEIGIQYNFLKTQLEEGKIAKEEYESAVRSLAEALGIEAESLETVENRLKALTQTELEQAIQETKTAIVKQESQALEEFWYQERYHQYDNRITSRFADRIKAGESSVSAMLNAYKEVEAEAEDISYRIEHGMFDYGEYIKGEDDLRMLLNSYEADIEAYSDLIEPLIEQYGSLEKLQEQLEKLKTGELSPEETEELTQSLENQNEAIETQVRSYHALADAIKEATDALTDYEKITSSEKDDNYKKYAEAWQKAFEDIQAGRRNSNAVNAALDLFFTPEQILSMRKRGVEAADVIANDFFRSIFTYMDEEDVMQFIKGEDSGSVLAYKLFGDVAELQEDGKKVIKLGEYVAASFEEVNGELQLSVNDVGLLSQALQRMGYDVSPEFLTVWLEALGVFSDQFIYTADVIKEFAGNVGALTAEGKVDLKELITGQLDLGTPTEEVIDLLNAVLAMADAGEIELTVSGDELSSTITDCESLITQRDDLDESTAKVGVEADTEQTETALDGVEDQLTSLARAWWITVRADTSQAENAISGLIARQQAVTQYGYIPKNTYASGTKNAGGGLALVNEEAPELILENGAARIAGSGMPTLTYLANGATVYTARETRAILGGSYPSPLFDGINAYANGLASSGLGYNIGGIQRWTPPASSSSGSSSSSSGTSSSSSSSYSAASTASAAASSSSSSSGSSSKDKDPQLQALEDRVKLLKSELSLMEERDESLDSQIDKQREIQKALQDQIIYLGTIGGDQTEINKLWEEFWKIDNDVRDLRIEKAKSELEVLEAADRPIREQIEKQREIATIYKEKLDILQQTGGSQTEINKLLKEELAIQKEIAEMNKQLMGDLGDAIEREIDALNEERDGYIQSIQDEIDALNKERDAQEEVNKEEELNLALIKAREDLMNAQNERTVRHYNAATGQWEWVADAQQVKSAQDAYDSAMKALLDYQDESAFNAKIDALVAEQERYTELYAEKTDKWEEILKSLEDPVMTIAEALKAIEDNATRDMEEQITDLNKLLAPLGYSISTEKLYDSGGILSGIGGIKATAMDEAILPPDITARLLKPIQPAMFEQRMNELRYLYGANGLNFAGNGAGNIGSQHNGDLYTFENVTLTTEQAQNTTIYDFVQAAKGLRSYSARM